MSSDGQPERRLDLGAGQWVEIEDFGAWTQRRFDAFRELVRALSSGTAQSDEEERFLRLGVCAWHLLDGDDPAIVLNDPKTDDLRALTVGTTRTIVERIVEVVHAAVSPFPQLKRPPSSSTS